MGRRTIKKFLDLGAHVAEIDDPESLEGLAADALRCLSGETIISLVLNILDQKEKEVLLRWTALDLSGQPLPDEEGAE